MAQPPGRDPSRPFAAVAAHEDPSLSHPGCRARGLDKETLRILRQPKGEALASSDGRPFSTGCLTGSRNCWWPTSTSARTSLMTCASRSPTSCAAWRRRDCLTPPPTQPEARSIDRSPKSKACSSVRRPVAHRPDRAGARRAAFKPINLAEIAREVVEAFQPAADDGGRTLVSRLDKPLLTHGG